MRVWQMPYCAVWRMPEGRPEVRDQVRGAEALDAARPGATLRRLRGEAPAEALDAGNAARSTAPQRGNTPGHGPETPPSRRKDPPAGTPTPPRGQGGRPRRQLTNQFGTGGGSGRQVFALTVSSRRGRTSWTSLNRRSSPPCCSTGTVRPASRGAGFEPASPILVSTLHRVRRFCRTPEVESCRVGKLTRCDIATGRLNLHA